MVSKGETETVLRNVVPAITSALPPSAMLASPVLSAILLPRAMPLPGARRRISALLLPGGCLLLRALRVLFMLLLRLPGLLLLGL